MVHIFKQSGRDKRGYNLKLSYIPNAMPRKNIENKRLHPCQRGARAFAEKRLMWATATAWTAALFCAKLTTENRQDRVFMFGAMGFGSRGAYAADLTKADNNDPTKASLFDVKNGNNGNANSNNRVELGYTVGTPQISKTHDGKYALSSPRVMRLKTLTTAKIKPRCMCMIWKAAVR